MRLPALLLLIAATCAGTACSSLRDGAPAGAAAAPARSSAALGVRTRDPSPEEVEGMALAFEIRAQGRVIESTRAGSAAERAELAPGDVLVSLDGHTLYSQDDLDDALRVRTAGSEAELVVKRAGRSSEERVRVTLDAGPSASETGIPWRYAGLVQLDAASAEARASGREVLVGLSGAET
jgi:predicted metalloprotease with PDZ domain